MSGRHLAAGPMRAVAGRLAGAVGLGTAAAAAGVGLLVCSAWLLARAAQEPPVLYLLVAIVAVRAFGLGKGVLRYAERLVAHDAALRMLAALRLAVYRCWLRLGPRGSGGFGRTRTADRVSAVVSDVDAAQDLAVRVLVPVASSLLVAAAAVTLSSLLLPAAGLALAASSLVAGVAVPLWVSAAGRRYTRRLPTLRARLAVVVQELADTAEERCVHGVTEAGLAELDRLEQLVRVSARRARQVDALGVVLGWAALAGCLVVSLAAGADAVRTGRLSGVVLSVVVLLPVAVHDVLADVAPAIARRDEALAAMRRLDDLAVQADELDPRRSRAAPRARRPNRLPIDAGGSLRMRGVHAGWTPGDDVLHGVDLDLAAGRRIALVGASGTGKSTLAAVLLQLLPCSRGQVLLDGVDASRFDPEQVRGVIGLLDQQAHVFDTTIAENLRIGSPDASAEQLWDVLGRVRLASAVRRLPRGLDTAVGEHGASLSGGERQRLALARLLLARHRIVVLDEPAEHLDVPVARALTRDLLAAADDRGVLLITHAHEGLADCDEVVVLRDGRVAARGRYDDLAAGPGPFRDVMGPAPTHAAPRPVRSPA